MTKTKSQKKKARAQALVGRGDYSISGADSVAKAIHDVDKRLNRIESTTKGTAKTVQGQLAGGLGRVAGNMIGGQGDLGQKAGETLAKWFGYGDYNLTKNSLINPDPSLGLKFHTDGKRGIRIMEREFLGDIYAGNLVSGSTEFTNSVYPINPGDPRTFPWLSHIASNFDQWKPNGIIFEFKSTSSSFNGASQALGVVVAATDYDVLDEPYSNKIEMETADYSNSCKASDDLMHGIECEAKERPDSVFFVRHQPNPTDSLRFYDLGNFQLATKGMSAADVVLGELWITYDITFYKKQLNTVPRVSGWQLYTLNSTQADISGETIGGNAVYGDLPMTYTSNLNVLVLTFPLTATGRYVVTAYGTWGGGALSLGTGNCSSIVTYGGDSNNTHASGNAAPHTLHSVVEITGTPATLTISDSAASWGASEFVVNVVRAPNNLELIQ